MTRKYRVLISAMAIVLASGGRQTAGQAPTEQPRSPSAAASYTFLIGSGFLCEPGDTSMCPATVRGNSQDSYEMTGAGTFDVQSKSVKAAGTFDHKSRYGNVLETGVWIATELVGFEGYGAAPGALPRQGLAFGHVPFSSKRLPMLPGPMPTGGLATFRIKLLPTQGSPRSAVLQVNCALGDVPHERSVEGIRLAFDRTNSEFSEELGGRVMFLSMQPEVNPPREQQRGAVPETSETTRN